MINVTQAKEEHIQVICSFDHIAKAGDESRKEFIAESVKKQACYVAEMNGAAVAYAVLDYDFYACGMIEMLYVHPDFRRKGVGTELIIHIESICKTEKLFTSTNQSNLPMQGLLNKIGYVPSGFSERCLLSWVADAPIRPERDFDWPVTYPGLIDQAVPRLSLTESFKKNLGITGFFLNCKEVT